MHEGLCVKIQRLVERDSKIKPVEEILRISRKIWTV